MWKNFASFAKRFMEGIIPVWEWLITPIGAFESVLGVSIAPIWLLTGSFLIAWIIFIIAKELIEV